MPVDLVIVRENTEDLYAGIEFEQGKPDTGELIDYINRVSPDRKIKLGPRRDGRLDQADQHLGHRADRPLRLRVRPGQRPQEGHGRPQGEHHEVHRRPVSGHGPHAWPRSFRSDIEFEDRIVDNMCMQLVQKPELYDVLVLPNLYGDILSDLAAGLVGGLGVAPGANIGPDGAVFEATHGSAPKYKGQNKVNPTALILSGMLMLRHLKRERRRRPAGKGRRRRDRRRQGRHLRHEARPRRPHRRRHPGDGRGDLCEVGRIARR